MVSAGAESLTTLVPVINHFLRVCVCALYIWFCVVRGVYVWHGVLWVCVCRQ